MKINEKKLDEVMLELGHSESLRGTEYIRVGAALYEREISMTKELYPAIARATGAASSSAVERSIRTAISSAWNRGSIEAQRRYFGYSIHPDRGAPTNSEYIARIVRVCGED